MLEVCFSHFIYIKVLSFLSINLKFRVFFYNCHKILKLLLQFRPLKLSISLVSLYHINQCLVILLFSSLLNRWQPSIKGLIRQCDYLLLDFGYLTCLLFVLFVHFLQLFLLYLNTIYDCVGLFLCQVEMIFLLNTGAKIFRFRLLPQVFVLTFLLPSVNLLLNEVDFVYGVIQSFDVISCFLLFVYLFEELSVLHRVALFFEEF